MKMALYYSISVSMCTLYIWAVSTCGCGLAQQCVRGLHCGHHGAGGGVCDGGGVVGVLCLRVAVSLQPLRLGEHSLASKRH